MVRPLTVHARRVWLGIGVALLAVAVGVTPALANLALTQISSDPFTNTTSQHATEVEPDSFSSGSTIVTAFQQGRFTDGGSSDIGFATSTDGGSTWTHGSLPGITTFNGGTFARVSDPAVAFDAKHAVWLISTLPIDANVNGAGVLTSRSADGLTWGSPVTVASQTGADKNWIACDNTTTSPFFGNCYTEWDDNAQGNLLQMSTSSDGGLTWGPPRTTAGNNTGIGGQPLAQPNGTVVVPVDSANESTIGAFTSTDGGASWSSVTSIARIKFHTPAGGLRSGPLPSAEIDAAGNVFVAWSDCRFRRGCSSNDIVFATSSNGVNWSAVQRVPIDATNSGVDHFLPGLGVDVATSGAGAHLGLVYYFYPQANCTSSTCQLDVGFISSTTGGSTWGAATMVAGPISLSWIASTNQGSMVGDYMSTSFSGSTAHPVFIVATAPSGGVFNEFAATTASGLAAAASTTAAESAGAEQAPAWAGAAPRTSH